MIDGVRVELRADRVPPGQSISHDAHDLHQEAERRWLDGLQHGFLGSPGMEIETRIVWSSELGHPRSGREPIVPDGFSGSSQSRV